MNFISDINQEKQRESFFKEAMLLRQALSFAVRYSPQRNDTKPPTSKQCGLFLPALLARASRCPLKEINARVNELLKASIQSEGVINLFSDVDTGFSLFDPKFLDEIAKMKEKNLAVEILKKLLAEQVSLYRRTNLVKSEKFSEMLSRAMKAYLNGMLSNEESLPS